MADKAGRDAFNDPDPGGRRGDPGHGPVRHGLARLGARLEGDRPSRARSMQIILLASAALWIPILLLLWWLA